MKYKSKFEIRFFLNDNIKGFNKKSKSLKKYLNNYKSVNGVPSTEEEAESLIDKVIEAYPDVSHFKVEKVYMI